MTIAVTPQRELLGAATVVGILTVVSRIAGFGRVIVFGGTVGLGDLGDAYQAANTVPNIIFDLVAGGALASLVVPLLAGPASRDDRKVVAETVSTLLTWVVGVLTALALVVAVAARPLLGLLAPGHASPEVLDAGTAMLRVFAPQLPLYGVGIILTGVLQTYRRFSWPVIAPLLSSLTVMAVYVTFAAVAGHTPLKDLSGGTLLILSGGTTLAVAVLSLCLLIPMRRLHLRLRPATRLDGSAARALRPLALAGVVTLGAQQLTTAFFLALAWRGPTGSVVVFTIAQTIYLLPWAVLALPIATTTYPALAEAGAAADHDRFARTLAPAVRTIVLLCALGAAALAVLAVPAGTILADVEAQAPPAARIAAGIAGFAPGLVGYGLFALLSRALYAQGAAFVAAVATAAGWAAAALAGFGFAAAAPTVDRVAALSLANSAGMIVLGAGLAWGVRRKAGPAALRGFGRTLVAALTSALLAAGAGYGVLRLVWGAATPGWAAAVAQGMLCGTVVAAVFIVTAGLTDRDTTAPLLRRFLRRA